MPLQSTSPSSPHGQSDFALTYATPEQVSLASSRPWPTGLRLAKHLDETVSFNMTIASEYIKSCYGVSAQNLFNRWCESRKGQDRSATALSLRQLTDSLKQDHLDRTARSHGTTPVRAFRTMLEESHIDDVIDRGDLTGADHQMEMLMSLRSTKADLGRLRIEDRRRKCVDGRASSILRANFMAPTAWTVATAAGVGLLAYMLWRRDEDQMG